MQNVLKWLFGSHYSQSHLVLIVIELGLLVLMLLLSLAKLNIPLFLVFNGLSSYTGGWVWANLTSLGEGLIVLSFAGLLTIKAPRAAWTVLVAGIIGTLIVHGVKEAVGALRPAMILPKDSFTIIGPILNVVSFPSGHTSTITAFATILFLHAKDRRVAWIWLPIVVLVGISRMAVGAHWPMDVLGGWFFGILIALLCFSLTERWQFGDRALVQWVIVILSLACAASLFWVPPLMPQAIVLRWLFGAIGLFFSLAALPVVYRRSKTGKSQDIKA